MHRVSRLLAILLACLWVGQAGLAQPAFRADSASSPAGPAISHGNTTLFEALGGRQGVTRITADVIQLYMRDPRLHAYFDNINPDWLTARISNHLCMILDGGCVYHGRSMAATHRGLHIDQAAFDVVVEDLQLVLRRDNIDFHTQNRLLARLAPMERDIVTR